MSVPMWLVVPLVVFVALMVGVWMWDYHQDRLARKQRLEWERELAYLVAQKEARRATDSELVGRVRGPGVGGSDQARDERRDARHAAITKVRESIGRMPTASSGGSDD